VISFTTRRATLSDLEELVQLRLQLFHETGEFAGDVPPPEVVEATYLYLQQSLPTELFLAWVAEAEGRIIGISGLIFFQKPPTAKNISGLEAYVMNMYTLPEWRGRGVAFSLFQEILRHVQTTPAKRIWLRTTDDGRYLYEKLGFVYTKDEMELSL
jgi:GNAT superfamily N-acetyltransferase